MLSLSIPAKEEAVQLVKCEKINPPVIPLRTCEEAYGEVQTERIKNVKVPRFTTLKEMAVVKSEDGVAYFTGRIQRRGTDSIYTGYFEIEGTKVFLFTGELRISADQLEYDYAGTFAVKMEEKAVGELNTINIECKYSPKDNLFVCDRRTFYAVTVEGVTIRYIEEEAYFQMEYRNGDYFRYQGGVGEIKLYGEQYQVYGAGYFKEVLNTSKEGKRQQMNAPTRIAGKVRYYQGEQEYIFDINPVFSAEFACQRTLNYFLEQKLKGVGIDISERERPITMSSDKEHSCLVDTEKLEELYSYSRNDGCLVSEYLPFYCDKDIFQIRTRYEKKLADTDHSYLLIRNGNTSGVLCLTEFKDKILITKQEITGIYTGSNIQYNIEAQKGVWQIDGNEYYLYSLEEYKNQPTRYPYLNSIIKKYGANTAGLVVISGAGIIDRVLNIWEILCMTTEMQRVYLATCSTAGVHISFGDLREIESIQIEVHDLEQKQLFKGEADMPNVSNYKAIGKQFCIMTGVRRGNRKNGEIEYIGTCRMQVSGVKGIVQKLFKGRLYIPADRSETHYNGTFQYVATGKKEGFVPPKTAPCMYSITDNIKVTEENVSRIRGTESKEIYGCVTGSHERMYIKIEDTLYGVERCPEGYLRYACKGSDYRHIRGMVVKGCNRGYTIGSVLTELGDRYKMSCNAVGSNISEGVQNTPLVYSGIRLSDIRELPAGGTLKDGKIVGADGGIITEIPESQAMPNYFYITNNMLVVHKDGLKYLLPKLTDIVKIPEEDVLIKAPKNTPEK